MHCNIAKIQNTIISVIPPNIRRDVAELSIVNHTLETWIAGQGTVILTLCGLYATGLYIIGLPYALTLGVTTGLLYIIPVVGPLISIILTGTITIASNGLDSWILGQVIALYFAVHTLESLVLTPFFVGSSLGLNLPLLLFSILIGGGLFGGVGIVLSVPIASIIKKTLIMVEQKKSSEWLYD